MKMNLMLVCGTPSLGSVRVCVCVYMCVCVCHRVCMRCCLLVTVFDFFAFVFKISVGLLWPPYVIGQAIIF